MSQEIVVQGDVPAVMRDSKTPMSNVYRPASGGPYPVLLTRLPYGKDQPFDSAYFDPVKEITPSSSPRWDRNPNTGESSVYSARTNVARHRIFHDPQRPSHITLTVGDG